MNNTPKRTKIVATLGPATSTKEQIKEIINAGANMVRINTSHASVDDHRETVKTVREAAQELNVFLPVLIDLQGPKIRIGNIKENIDLKMDDVVTIAHATEQTDGIIPVDYDGIANDVHEGSKILIDDGKIQLEVLKSEDNKVTAKVVNPGTLKPRKGLNIPGTTASLSAVTAQDIEYIRFAIEIDADYIALSFVREAEDIMLAKRHITNFDGNIPVIAKIEKPQAVDNIESILDAADGIMVARGDLGIEISPEKVPIVQKRIINLANQQSKVVIVATQMLETMIEQPIPTRAEASDVANAIIDGADAVMLSGETSVGHFAKGAVQMMSSIAHDVENSPFCPYNANITINAKFETTPQAIVASAAKLADDVHAKMLLIFTHSGYTPRFLSKLRPRMPIIAVSDSIKTCRKLSLLWNITSAYRNWDINFDEDLLQRLDDFLLSNTCLETGDRIIIVGSLPKLISGRTNFTRVHRIGKAK